ncbi:MAG: HEAT repeat domain-containing protein [Armatimonadota bacterium]|nr:HEAT repeat domain-containing protein [Armatimonadota bacterium]MDW8026500.1 HEAT repeat domain-containing protein [Armatimonadota bacterium]
MPLIKRLGDEDWLMRKAACEELGRIGDNRCVAPLIERLGDEDWLVRKAACEGLNAIWRTLWLLRHKMLRSQDS